jgi:hypothetical protein
MKNNDEASLTILKGYYSEHGVFPSYSTIAKLIGYKSKASVSDFIERMKNLDIIAVTPENKIKPGIKFTNNNICNGMSNEYNE